MEHAHTLPAAKKSVTSPRVTTEPRGLLREHAYWRSKEWLKLAWASLRTSAAPSTPSTPTSVRWSQRIASTYSSHIAAGGTPTAMTCRVDAKILERSGANGHEAGIAARSRSAESECGSFAASLTINAVGFSESAAAPHVGPSLARSPPSAVASCPAATPRNSTCCGLRYLLRCPLKYAAFTRQGTRLPLRAHECGPEVV
jgi:hypothetical protein